ncbi:arabinofuranosyltransferase-like protein [Nocardia puris]|uniref:Galactan 5-O-arabinofuranosyltransferase n=2 Tax=Nocardia puris TaxID=208602 RepID=A0A366DDB9_9NOCA|nr:arabinofuranosyltransferase-like protein [Nocardia puris]
MIGTLCVAAILLRRVPVELACGSVQRWRAKFASFLAWAGISGYVTITVGMPLAATRLYLGGLSPDQQHRIQLVGRFADSPVWRDETFIALPPDEAAAWYWMAGRAAAILDLPGWEAFKLIAITSIAITATLSLLWWSRLVRAELAIAITTITTAATVAYAATDPARAVCLLLMPAAVFSVWRSTSSAITTGERDLAPTSPRFPAVAQLPALGAYLALCATFDRTAFGFAAPLMTAALLLAIVTNARHRIDSVRPIIVSAIAAAIPALSWITYQSLCTASAFTDIVPSTTEWRVVVVILLAAAAPAFAWATRSASLKVGTANQINRALTALVLIGFVNFSQNIPNMLATHVEYAYTDTDGDGRRADQFPASAVHHYRAVDNAIATATTPQPRRDIVVLTGDPSFLAIYPYSGFLPQSNRYSNPGADYDSRVRAIREWSTQRTAAELVSALDRSPQRPPSVFVLRRSGDGYVLRLAHDPTIDESRTYTTIMLGADLFDSRYFTRTDIGPFTVLARR